jgi:type II secretion system protein D
MMSSLIRRTLTPPALALLGLCALPAPAVAQEGRPTPQPAVPATVAQVIDEAEAEPAAAVETAAAPEPVDLNGRRPVGDEQVVLSFKDVSVEDTIPFIVEATGKVVMPVNITTLKAKKITLVNDRPIDRTQALDLLFQAFQLNDVGVIETDQHVIIAVLSEMPRHSPPVIGPDEDIMSFTNLGAIVTKIFAVENTDAENIADQLQDTLPDHASMSVDANSNQIIVTGDVALCQRLGQLIRELDRNYIKIKTETFRLAYADASEIAANILDLFEDTGTTATRSPRSAGVDRRRMSPSQRRQAAAAAAQARTAEATIGPTVELRVTVNVQQNSVTVSGEPSVVEEIAKLINESWDLPRPEATKKVYHLQYTDPIKMRDMLQELLGEAAGGGGGARRTRAPGGATGQRTDVAEAIGGIYQIQAYPDSNSLVVICKTEESFDFLDSLIMDLDQPVYPGIPVVVELKHADAEQVADQVNAIFAPAGARVDIQRRDTGLQGIDIGGPAGDTTSAGGTTTGREGEQGGTITFPWQQGRQAEDETPESPLIGRIRVVPIHRQNAVMILAAPEYREAVRDIITEDLDKPARQVMIAAIIAEVVLSDELSLGLRWGSSLPVTPGDNRLGASASLESVIDNPLSGIFDQGTLTITSNLTVILDALAKKTKFRILQDPVVFTADNQEAAFFQGQDVPIQQSTQGNQGFVTQSFQYQAVGIGLNARPRITKEGDVDMEINLVISNINVAATAAANAEAAPFLDRRETTTQVIVKDGQTIVISGILKDEESRVTRKFPLLGDIPLIGALFTSISNETTRTELLAFVTPYVVETPDENDVNFNERARQRLENLSKSLKEQEAQQKNLHEEIRKRLLQPQIDKGRLPPDALDQPADQPSQG